MPNSYINRRLIIDSERSPSITMFPPPPYIRPVIGDTILHTVYLFSKEGEVSNSSLAFRLKGLGLQADGDITITPDASTEVFDGLNWVTSPTLVHYTGTSIDTLEIYKIRSIDSLSSGDYIASVTLSGGEAADFPITVNIKVSEIVYDIDMQNWLDQPEPQVTNTENIAINNFIVGCKEDNNWIFDRFWINGLSNQQRSNVSLSFPTSTRKEPIASPTWQPSVGYSTSPNKYLNTHYNAATDGVNYIIGDAAFGFYGQALQNSFGFAMGCNDGGVRIQLCPYYSSGTSWASLNVDSFLASSISDYKGLFIVYQDNQRIYNSLNGIDQYSFLYNNASALIPNYENYTGCQNSVGVPNSFYSAEFFIEFYGSGSIDKPKLFTRIQTLASALGYNI